ncbi:protein EVI2B [Perca flavescens]|uniref:protein EVI2B n=1 Tax=Perca flavescens TaxID=8167 RepID=UPI00106EC6A4|nr:protein EVI2B [Perca flavescens]XP_028425820.1 protein EVI2B [Perca flavescens]
MTIDFVNLIYIWLLPLTASSAVTSGQNNDYTIVMIGPQVARNKFTHDQLTTQEASSLNPLLDVSGRKITPSITVDVNLTEEKATKLSTKPLLQTVQQFKTPSKTVLPGITTAATPTNEGSMKSTTEIQLKVTTSATTVVTSHSSISTTTTRVPSMLSSSTQNQLTSDKTTHPPKRPTQSANLISTTTTSTKPVENKSTNTSPVTVGDATQSIGLYNTTIATTKTPFSHITKAKERQDPPEKNAKSNKEKHHSKAVAGLIGGALILMMVGFLIIYIKKQMLQRQQITTRDWAGPSPFLEGGADNSQATLRSSNQISLSSFLPHRLSKRLSLLPETNEKLEDMTKGTTFGNKHQGSTFGQEVDGNDVQESYGTAVVVSEIKSTEDVPETVENSVLATSSQTEENPLYTYNN